jgi:flavin-binding protein dodecin
VSVYRVTDLIGTSTESWEDAAVSAIKVAQHTLRDLRVGQVSQQDVAIEEDGSFVFRTRLQVSFKYEEGE